MELQFENLSPRNRHAICNGIGPRRWKFGSLQFNFKLPDFIFKRAGEIHDFAYWTGGSIFDKLLYDWVFLRHMCHEIEKVQSYILKAFYFFWAYCYFFVVISAGHLYFHFGTPRSWKDLPFPQEVPNGSR
jgi:hypothetical protein